MLHLLLYGVLAVVLAGGLFAVAARFLPAGEQIAPPVRDEPPWELPADRAITPEEVDAVRLPVALRGYRFAETDILLDRLARELRARDEEIARLRDEIGSLPPAVEPAAAAVADAPVEPVGEAQLEEPAVAEPVSDEPLEPVVAEEPVDEPDAAQPGAASTSSGSWGDDAPPWAVVPAPSVVGPSAQSPAAASTESGSHRRRRRRRK